MIVTGAGGSIGSEIVRQIRSLRPAAVFLLDHDESVLHGLQLELHGHGLLTDPLVLLADIRDGDTIHRLFDEIRPDIVFHAAAHKHLPLLERFPAEGIATNVIGTRNVVAAAVAVGAERVVNVSTDKAAEPSSVLGATKRVAESIAASYAGPYTKIASVRFGNVLGSRGSLLTSLRWQVANARDITVTDAAATRFFMTIPEAASLVIESAVLAEGGETYILDMGQPVRILDLVHNYLALSGANNSIVFTGLRSGEKLHEQLVDNRVEAVSTTVHPQISRIDCSAIDNAKFCAELDALCEAARAGNRADLLSMLWALAEPRPIQNDDQAALVELAS